GAVTTAQTPITAASGGHPDSLTVAGDAANGAAMDHESLDLDGADMEAADLDGEGVFELPEPAAAPEVEAVAGPGVQRAPQQSTPRSSAHAAAHAEARELFRRMADLSPEDPARSQIRDRLVRMHLPLVEHLARRFRNRGEPLDDLTQVATIGLIKRHFRDKGWAVRVPRRLQELRLSLTAATSELSQRNGRSPTVAELATHLG